jgi:peptidoglycan/xylan/chitin deacetylase (PgdA/CDA1 family)
MKIAGMKALRLLVAFSICGCLVLAGGRGTQYEAAKKKPASVGKFPWPQGIRGAVSLTFDDARLSQVDRLLPILDRFGVKATFYISMDRLAERLEGWKKAVRTGHEIGNHTLTHPCTGNYPAFRWNALEEMTIDGMGKEIDDAQRAIVGALGIEPRSFAFPCGQTFVGRGRDVKSYVPLIAERFLSGRKWLNEDANDPAFCDLAQLLAFESDGKPFDALKLLVDKAAAEGRWLILVGHEVGDAGYQTTLASSIEALCRYCREPTNGIRIDTVGAIADTILKARTK